MRFASALAFALSVTLALPAGVARADGGDAVAPVGSDVVRAHDGRVLRGTLVERDPNGNVTIQLVTGAVRTLPMSEVAYAGPLQAEPKAPPPLPPPAPTPVAVDPSTAPRPVALVKAQVFPVRVESKTPHVGLHMRAGQGHVVGTALTTSTNGSLGWGVVSADTKTYQDLCVAPCELSMAEGEYRMGLSGNGGRVKETDDPIAVRGPMTLHVDYESRAGQRLGGYVLIAASVAGGAAMVSAGRPTVETVTRGTDSYGYPVTESVEHRDDTLMNAGWIVMAAGSLVGLILAGLQDVATITPSVEGAPKKDSTAAAPKVHVGFGGIAGTF